ncbi:Oidioi.mRNA.OKI2018_I69.XSR.g16593.t1.cds [Oikopleura dioica]|uniref:Oidioi.mRNA.OKI2018_I69.XSR.g16593.t1.cds n=1 Tax=Oikopleura dioica TaxID=34765 RepID=A0ABN7SLR2_OIKDI|nr:Oidioi.mRNA.OKI2018_I69.XSR.g16593.t1.cds [Oikopleura dioica]
MMRKYKNCVIFLVYSIGMLYTSLAIVHNVTDFMKYHSSFKSDFVSSGHHRPVVTVCSDSMHSKMLKNKLYPNLTDLELRHFYGHKYAGHGTTQYAYPDLKLKEFFRSTMPFLKVVYCTYGNIKCKNNWKRVATFEGVCLQLNMHELDVSENEGGFASEMTVSFAFNVSDNTYGWNGMQKNLRLRNTVAQEKLQVTDLHLLRDDIPLSSTLKPIVMLSVEQIVFLGHPFTNCKKMEKGDSYYSKMWCEAKAKLEDIIYKCRCLPDYVDEFKAFNISAPNITNSCTFKDHAECITNLFTRAEWHTSCEDACESTKQRNANIRYQQVEPILDIIIRKKLHYSSDIILNHVTLMLAPPIFERKIEVADYPISALMADIGGDFGLFLGLSTIKLLKLIGYFLMQVEKKLSKAFTRCSSFGYKI